jgi:hypothetical protein
MNQQLWNTIVFLTTGAVICGEESVTISAERPPLQSQAAGPAAETPVHFSGVVPRLAMVADHSPRSEAGIGALMPWAGRLWAITYTAHKAATGSGTGLFTIDEDMQLHKHPASVVGTYANRFVHGPSDQLFIGPHAIDTQGNVRTIPALVDHRLAATTAHLGDPENKVYVLGMEGEFFEVDVKTLQARQLFDLTRELDLPKGTRPHFKSACTGHGRVVVTSNTYDRPDSLGQRAAGRLAEWDGKTWKIIERAPFVEAWTVGGFDSPMVAMGWDQASAILKVFAEDQWLTYRLPKNSRIWDATSNTEWMRVREVETERALIDFHGMFYEFAYHAHGGQVSSLRPIASHLRVIPDFCSWRGMLVLAGNQATPMGVTKDRLDRNPAAGQPQAGLWFGKTDDLWNFGKPTGAGSVWREAKVRAGEVSPPYLMRGFDKKVVHVRHDAKTPVPFALEIDILGDGTWSEYRTIVVPNSGYAYHVFPDGFSAEWVRVRVGGDCNATVHFIYQ